MELQRKYIYTLLILFIILLNKSLLSVTLLCNYKFIKLYFYYNSSKNDNCALSGNPFSVPISLKYSTTVEDTLPRLEKSSIDKNGFSKRA